MEETKIESKDLGQDGFKVIHYKTIDSTQKEIWRRVKNGTIENNWHTVRKKEYFLEKCSFFCGTKNWHETCSIYKYQ